MTMQAWHEVLHGDRWKSTRCLWVEGADEYSFKQVSKLADRLVECVDPHASVVEITASSKLAYFAMQLGLWRRQIIPVVNDGSLREVETGQVAADGRLTVRGDLGVEYSRLAGPHRRQPLHQRGIVTVNFTSGSSGARKAVAVTHENLVATWTDSSLGRSTSGSSAASFAEPTFDGWWFDTWRTAVSGKRVVCLPGVNEDVYRWPELIARYAVGQVLLPAAVLSTLLDVAPECLRGLRTIFSGGEEFGSTVVARARDAGLSSNFVNLFGPTEATFATHRYDLSQGVVKGVVPIGRALSSAKQLLRPVSDAQDLFELIVEGPLICAGYMQDGNLGRKFVGTDGQPSFSTGDLVRRAPSGDLIFAGRRDRLLKVAGRRIDAANLEYEVATVSGVRDCRLVQREHKAVLFVVPGVCTDVDGLTTEVARTTRRFSPSIGIVTVERLPIRKGGKVDEEALLETQESGK